MLLKISFTNAEMLPQFGAVCVLCKFLLFNVSLSFFFFSAISFVPSQALIYPLTVASKSALPARTRAAQRALEVMREHSAKLVNQAVMVGNLCRLFHI